MEWSGGEWRTEKGQSGEAGERGKALRGEERSGEENFLCRFIKILKIKFHYFKYKNLMRTRRRGGGERGARRGGRGAGGVVGAKGCEENY